MVDTLIAMLGQRVAAAPTHTAYRYVTSDLNDTSINYKELDAAAGRIAGRLQHLSKTSRTALLVYGSVGNFIEAFWGCIYAGIIAVPVPVSRERQSPLSSIAADCGAQVILTDAALAEEVGRIFEVSSADPPLVLDTSAIANEPAASWTARESQAGEVAYLQYTSGSTSAPRGVCVTHANVLSNLADIDEVFEHGSGDCCVSWLPHYHDMGLVYGILQPVFSGIPGVLLSPDVFMRNPLRWLKIISDYRATHSGAPNFGYDLCVRRSLHRDCNGLDLSRWRVAFCGAEQVRRETLVRFAAAFRAAGFRESSFYPAYGLAEATLKVTCRRKDRPVAYLDTPNGSGKLVRASCGWTSSRTRLRIVDPDRQAPCAAGEVGEIWVAGAGVAAGYWNRLKESRETFMAYLGGDGPFVRTGDLGLVHDDELFVIGRIKELIIARGRNLYPQDLEATAEAAHPSIRSGCVAAFAVEDEDEEGVVVVAEIRNATREEYRVAAETIRGALSEVHQVVPRSVILVKHGAVPKTTSGKIQRNLCRSRFLTGELQSIYELGMSTGGSSESDDLELMAKEVAKAESGRLIEVSEAYVMALVSKTTGQMAHDLDPGKTLVFLGLDSMGAAELEMALESTLGFRIRAAALLGGLSMRGLSEKIIEFLNSKTGEKRNAARLSDCEPAREEDCTAASVEQERLFLLEKGGLNSSALNIAAAVQIEGPLSIDKLQDALASVVQHHEILQTTFELRDEQVLQVRAPSTPVALSLVDLTRAEPSAANQITAYVRRELGKRFDLGCGGCLRVFLFRTAPGRHVLSVILHHIIGDAWSLRLLFEEIFRRYGVPALSPAIREPELPQYTQAVRWEHEYQEMSDTREHLAYWKQRLAQVPARTRIDASRLPHQGGQGTTESFDVSSATAALVAQFSRENGVTVFMTLLAVFAATLESLEQETPVIGVPVMGRRGHAEMGIIGPFSYPLPFVVDTPRGCIFRDLLASTRNQALALYEYQDISYATLARELGGDAVRFRFLLTMLPPSIEKNRVGELSVAPYFVEAGPLNLDVYAAATEFGDGLRLSFALSPEAAASKLSNVCDVYRSLLLAVLESPEKKIHELASAPFLPADPEQIVVSSTFTADPIADGIAFWMARLERNTRVLLAPLNQVYQQLLDPGSISRTNFRGVNVLVVRIEELIPSRNESERQQFIDAVKVAAFANSDALWVVVFCPSFAVEAEEIEECIAVRISAYDSVHVIRSRTLSRGAQGIAYRDQEADKLGALPYTSEFMVWVATKVARTIDAARRGAYKVIVLDCDYTLWNAICGELEDSAMELDPAYRFLQEFLVARHDDGMLLCLCSKNNPGDVEAVFQNNPTMPLGERHIVARRIGWTPKSEGILALSQELNLALDSFIFVDDDPVECAEVRRNLPQVLTLQLPSQPEAIQAFLENVWAFDVLKTTEEDRARPTLYRGEHLRSAAKGEAVSLEQFLDDLQLEVNIRPLAFESCLRVSQLSKRTNQFNLNGARYSEAELRRVLQSPTCRALIVSARDRFGDYGTIGGALCEMNGERFHIAGLWISCRALGRGIESKLMAEIGRIAAEEGYAQVSFGYVDTSRNVPIRIFLERLAGTQGTQSTFRIPVEVLTAERRIIVGDLADMRISPASSAEASGRANWQRVEQIATDFSDPARVARAMRVNRQPVNPPPGPTQRDGVERTLREIYESMLGYDKVGLHDDFFALGGDSLMAVRVLARINREFSIDLPLDVFFESEFTVAALAERVERSIAASAI